MALDRYRLAHVRSLPDGGYTAQCPVCHAAGGDSHGVHLRVFASGAFACVVHPGDRHHRSLIWQAAGDRSCASSPHGVVRVAARSARRASLLEDLDYVRPRIFARPWAPDAIRSDSPARIPSAAADQAAVLLRLFRPLDVLWIGHLCDSGQEWHASHFRPAKDWLRTDRIPPGPRICTCTFRPGVCSRSQDSMLARRFLVVEADSIDLPAQGSILRWLSGLGLKLRAIVHSGGRSLHGWFDYPAARKLEDLRLLLPALGCDPALFNPVQPVRLPGWRRPDSGTIPQLLYLAP
jgi:hypothetical protein